MPYLLNSDKFKDFVRKQQYYYSSVTYPPAHLVFKPCFSQLASIEWSMEKSRQAESMNEAEQVLGTITITITITFAITTYGVSRESHKLLFWAQLVVLDQAQYKKVHGRVEEGIVKAKTEIEETKVRSSSWHRDHHCR